MESLLKKIHDRVAEEVEEILECDNWKKEHVDILEDLMEIMATVKGIQKYYSDEVKEINQEREDGSLPSLFFYTNAL